MIYVLIGPNAGKTGVWGGAVFTGGRTEIPDDAQVFGRILRTFYGAVPESEVPVTTPEPAGEPDATPLAEMTNADLRVLAEAKGIEVGSRDTKAALIAAIEAAA